MASARVALVVLAALLALLPGVLDDRAAEASPVSMATVALEGDSVTVAGTAFRDPGTYALLEARGAHVNESGAVAFAAKTTGTPSPEPCTILRGSISGPPHTIIAADGDEAPSPFTGQPMDVCDLSDNLPSSDPIVNGAGSVAYEAMVAGGWSLWLLNSSGPPAVLVAHQGDGDPEGGLYGDPELLGFNDNGYVLFQADSTGVPTLWLWDGATASKVVGEGDLLAGGPVSVLALGGGGQYARTATMNNNGEVAWRVTTSGGGGGSGGSIYTGTFSSPTKVVEAGDLWFSGPPVGDVFFTEVSEPRILDDGSVIYRATADSPYGDGYFLAGPDGSGGYTYEKRVLEADPNPETGSTWGPLVAPSAHNGQGGEVMLSADDGTSSETLYFYPSYDRVVGVGDSSPAGSSPYTSIKSASVNEKNLSISGVVAGPVLGCGAADCDGIFVGGTVTDPDNSVAIWIYPDLDTDGLSHISETDTNPATCGIDSDRNGTVDFSFDLDSDGTCDLDFAVADIFVEMDYMDCDAASSAPDNNDPKDVDEDSVLNEPDGMPDDDLPGSVCGGGDHHNHKPLGGIIEGGAAGPLGVYSCEDGVDNDSDTLTDLDDPDCSVVAAFADAPVHNPYSNEDGIATCGDGVDNGGGDNVDSADPDCWAIPGDSGSYDASLNEDKFLGTCNDGVDNNSDGKTDAGIDLLGDYDYVDPGDSPPDDDCTGINLHVVVDEALAHADYLDWAGAKQGGNACVNGLGYQAGHSAFELVKDYHFGSVGDNAATLAAKRLLFHYSLSTHMQDSATTSSGCGEMPGNDFYVSLGGWSNVTYKEHEATFMHELGHNLNLCHAGPRKLAVPDSQCDFNYKPNYLSVMNYTFSFPWTPDGKATSRKLDYSRVALPPGGGNILNENGALNEPLGIHGGTPAAVPAGWPKTAYTYVLGMTCPFNVSSSALGINWDMSGGALANNVTAPINDPVNPTPPPPSCFSPGVWLSPLKGYNDWDYLLYNFRGTPGYGDGLPTAPVPPDEPGSVPPPDTDTDGYHDGQDNCPDDYNPGQENNVHPGTLEGDHCEDTEPDGVFDIDDNCPDNANPNQEDVIHPNGIGDHCDDPDGDGVVDALDGDPDAQSPDFSDSGLGGDTYGSVVSGTVSVTDADDPADGVLLVASEASRVSMCDDFIAVDLEELGAVVATCGSAEVTIVHGPANVRSGPVFGAPYNDPAEGCYTATIQTGSTVRILELPPPAAAFGLKFTHLSGSVDVTTNTAGAPPDVPPMNPHAIPPGQNRQDDDADCVFQTGAGGGAMDNCPDDSNRGQDNTDDDLNGSGATVNAVAIPTDGDGDACDDDDDNDSFNGTTVVTQTPGAAATGCPGGSVDVWADCVESYLGTDLDDNCNGAPGSGTDAWPPDVDGNGTISGGDVFAVFPSWLTSAARYDLDASGTVSGGDVFTIFPWWLISCS